MNDQLQGTNTNEYQPLDPGIPPNNEEVGPSQETGDVDTNTQDENAPLLGKQDRNVTKKSHRTFGSNGNGATDNASHEDRDSEFYANENGRFQYHQNYRSFLTNWKCILNVVLFLNTLVLVLLFVSDYFIEILPADRNTTFTNFVLVIISLIGNAFNLSFTDIGLYSSFDWDLNLILTGLPVLNLLLLATTKYTRERIGFVTVLVHAWTVATFGLGLLQQHKLGTYITELTPPTTQNKHTIVEWFKIAFRNLIKFGTFIILVLIVLTTLLNVIDIHNALSYSLGTFHWTSSDHDNKLHVQCYGVGSASGVEVQDRNNTPIVLFEHGGEESSYVSGKWVEDLYNLGYIDKYCTYDRNGFGLSDSLSAPVSIRGMAENLRYALIEELKLNGPFLVVGYDYGGLVGRVFCGDNRELCSGLMLVESWNEELLLKHFLRRLLPGGGDGNDEDNGSDSIYYENDDDYRATRGKMDHRIPEREIGKRNGFKVFWHGLWSSLGLNLQFSWLVRRHGSLERIFGTDLKHQGKFLRTKLLESITSSLLTYQEILETNSKLKNVKMSVVSSKEMIKRSSLWGNWQRKLAKLSANTKEWKVVDGEHEFFNNGVGKEQAQDVLLRLLQSV
ncbi:hypothetical protein KAFR_0B04590 [Kazachstania africana CBS 2517]|uniref:AB hydrolase-1 domain-containing protein n=1 Tax=Kazachstania africana (strain ATCC 22294 / BCRC 22015 / CBS 2517 / CECT 1963 / NBRC 1671 / NRRL Y-8276) TaxID=1071382 RepID=H2AQV6_KAZAF|nr:hypothetical protein KAFR_0B04590 [Kazachstania africana CBS 2517]CCF56756.1 hypothetical protein KAFR_0B04590 [Kazachstania africana CBS 2517]